MDCSPPGSSVYGISQAKIQEQAAIPSPGDLPNPGIKPTSPTLVGAYGTVVNNPPANEEMWVRSLGHEDPLEEGMVTHFSGLQSMGLQKNRTQVSD